MKHLQDVSGLAEPPTKSSRTASSPAAGGVSSPADAGTASSAAAPAPAHPDFTAPDSPAPTVLGSPGCPAPLAIAVPDSRPERWKREALCPKRWRKGALSTAAEGAELQDPPPLAQEQSIVQYVGAAAASSPLPGAPVEDDRFDDDAFVLEPLEDNTDDSTVDCPEARAAFAKAFGLT